MDKSSCSSNLKDEEVIIECFKCGECGYSASSEDDLNQHRFNQHIFTTAFGFIEAENDKGGLKKLSSTKKTKKEVEKKQNRTRRRKDDCSVWFLGQEQSYLRLALGRLSGRSMEKEY